MIYHHIKKINLATINNFKIKDFSLVKQIIYMRNKYLFVQSIGETHIYIFYFYFSNVPTADVKLLKKC